MSTPLQAASESRQSFHPGPSFTQPSPLKGVGKRKVLVVDDEPEIVEEIIELLEDEGITAIGAADARAALKQIEVDFDIDVVLSDIRMPDMNGLEMARHVHSDVFSDRDISLIIMTGHAGMNEAIEALQIGAEDFLTKPLNPEQLIHAVRRGIESVRLRQRDRNYARDLSEEVKRKTEQAVSLSREVERKNAELFRKNEELKQSSRLKDEFLGMISHELNTPLNAIIGFAYVLESSLNEHGNSQDLDHARCIVSAGERLVKNVKSILTLADMQAGKLVAKKEAVVVSDLIDSAISSVRKTAEEKNISLASEKEDISLLVVADPNLIKTGLAAILENAVKFCDSGSSVSVDVKDDGAAVILSVSDNGPGIAPEILDAALEPFRQGDGSIQRRFEGMGLGLPLARKIALLNDARMGVVSSPEKGTTVSFVFPKADNDS